MWSESQQECRMQHVCKEYIKSARRAVPVRSTVYNRNTKNKASCNSRWKEKTVFKAEVRSVYRAYRGKLEQTVEWMGTHVGAAWCSPKYKQHADEQLSSLVCYFV
ncbi:UNVERIFIED_CONTAM: hypothetical protein NCL1_45725 [Trichonephila clavipes]